MSIFGDIFEKVNPSNLLKIKAGAYTDIEVAGVKIITFKIDGFKDEDNDGNPEFDLHIDTFGSFLDIDETIEIPLNLVSGGIFGTIGKVLSFSKIFGNIGDSKRDKFIKKINNVRSLIENK
jgi:hypothetical protein